MFGLGLLIIIILIVILIPKGNPIYEISSLPKYWNKIAQMDNSNIQVDRYTYGDHSRQYLLHCSPSTDVPPQKQVIVYYHGGGWLFGKPEMFISNASFFTSKGYHVFLPSYRRIPKFNYYDLKQDAVDSILKVRTIMSNYEIDYPIILGGISAGGNLSVFLAYDKECQIPMNQFSGIFVSGAPLDLQQMHQSFVLYAYAGKRNGEMFAKANPINYINEQSTVPMLCIHGEKDGLVEYSAAKTFVEKLKSINPDLIRHHYVPGGTHVGGFKWVYKDNETRKVIIEWLESIRE